MCKAKWETLGNGLQQHPALLAFRFAFRVFLIRLDRYIHLSKFTWK